MSDDDWPPRLDPYRVAPDGLPDELVEWQTLNAGAAGGERQ